MKLIEKIKAHNSLSETLRDYKKIRDEQNERIFTQEEVTGLAEIFWNTKQEILEEGAELINLLMKSGLIRIKTVATVDDSLVDLVNPTVKVIDGVIGINEENYFKK